MAKFPLSEISSGDVIPAYNYPPPPPTVLGPSLRLPMAVPQWYTPSVVLLRTLFWWPLPRAVGAYVLEQGNCRCGYMSHFPLFAILF